MGRVYTVTGENLSLGTGSVLVALQTAALPNAGALIRPLRVEVSQSGSSTSAMSRLVFSTRDTAGTLTTTSITPANGGVLGGPASGLAGNTSVIGGAGRIGINSSADSGGTYANHWANAPNVLSGYLYLPIPEERFIIPPSTVWCVRFAAAPGTTTGWNILFEYEEVI
jgi:hypothetical protein